MTDYPPREEERLSEVERERDEAKVEYDLLRDDYKQLLLDVERLTRERDEARAERDLLAEHQAAKITTGEKPN